MQEAALRRRAGTECESCSGLAHPSLFGLAPCGVYPASGFTAGAVRSYRTISPLPRRWSFRNGGRTRQAGSTRVLRFQGGPPERGVAEAVSFLWHWPSVGLETHIPDVIRHTALRSSDFPPPASLRVAPELSGSDRPVLLPVPSLPHFCFYPLLATPRMLGAPPSPRLRFCG